MLEHKKIAIYPGSFDPITYGHIDIIKRAICLFDKVIIAVAMNIQKEPLFSVKERVSMIQQSFLGNNHIDVQSFNGLLVDYAKERKASAIVRGLRAVSDFEYEFQMALVNRKLNDDIITVFLMTHDKYSYLNSSIVKELVQLGADTSCFVPDHVNDKLNIKLRKQ
jgi:pantetheine-phosphate adenylyltransferase